MPQINTHRSVTPSSRPPVSTSSKGNKLLATALLSLALIAGAGMIVKHDDSSSEAKSKSMAINPYKAEFIKGILALSDDTYQPLEVTQKESSAERQVMAADFDQFAPDELRPEVSSIGQLSDHYDHNLDHHHDHHHQHDQPFDDHSVSSSMPSHEVSQETSISADAQSRSPSMEEERLRALQSEALALNTSDQVESKHREEINALKLKIAEREAKYQYAKEQYEKKRISELQARQLQTPSSPLGLRHLIPMKPEFLKALNPELGSFRGALTKCHIKGHNIHWINDQGWILEHLKVNTPLIGNVLTAREIILQSNQKVVVVVYDKGYEAYDSLGNLLETGNRE